jgi:hypothetical protein
MSLQFDLVETQVKKMGVALADLDIQTAKQRQSAFDAFAQMGDNSAIWAKIMEARERDAGFRGAAPFNHELMNAAYPLPNLPDRATIYAADGSQIYPDSHGPVPYWLTNLGVFIYHHGLDALPEIKVQPTLYYEDADVRNPDGTIIGSGVVNARRTVAEMRWLSEVAVRPQSSDAYPRLALYDGPLIGMPIGKDVPNAADLTLEYHESMDFLFDAGALLAGYIDRPSSRFTLYTVYLMTLERNEISRANLTAPSFEGLGDADLYKPLLASGQRSGLMVQQSPLNKEYKERHGAHQEIVFFYLNTAAEKQSPYLARVEIPQWVAQHPEQIDAVHALLYSQAQITDRYPYALTRADEIAVVQPAEKRHLDEMIAVELLRNQQAVESSQKLSSKHFARHGRRQYDGV